MEQSAIYLAYPMSGRPPREVRSVNGLPERWLQRAADLEPYAPAAAEAFRRAAGELEVAIRDESEAVMNLAQAAVESGYSIDHLAREIRTGRLPNVGRRGAPRVRRGDLPKKPCLRTDPTTGMVNVTSKGQIARSVVNFERGRHDG